MNEERNPREVRAATAASPVSREEERKQGGSPPSPALVGPTEASAGERSETGDAGVGPTRAPRPTPLPPDPEVPAKPQRRTFTAAYKLRILEEADEAGPGGVGAILRREGLYSSHLAAWRKARRTGALRQLGRKRGRKARPVNPLEKKVERLEKDLARAQEQLRQAELIIDVQGKVAGLLGFSLGDGRSS